MWPDLELIGVYPSRLSGVYFIAKGVSPFSIHRRRGQKTEGKPEEEKQRIWTDFHFPRDF